MRLLRTLLLLATLAGGAVLTAARKEAWVEVRSPHFVAFTDAGEAEAREALAGFEAIRSVFGVAFPGIQVDPPKPLIVIVAEDEASMRRFLPGEFEGPDPARPAGFFTAGPDRSYAILRLDISRQADQPYFTLFHEYTHSIVHQNFPALPTWLDEGIADFYGATELRSAQVLLGRVPLVRLLKLREGALLPLETLLTVTHDSPSYREGGKTGIFYAQSWALVHYLFLDEEARKAGLFQAYLKALGGGLETLAAARQALGDLVRLQGSLARYVRRPTMGFWTLPLSVKLADRDFQARALGPAEALVVRAEFLQGTRHEPEARPLLERALALEPRRPEVHGALGFGHFLRGEKEQAALAFGEASRLGSSDFRAPYYLALLAQEQQGPGAQESARILGWLESARQLRPDFPGIHMALCRQYTWAPRDPGRALQEGLAAVRLEPQNLAYRANLGHACQSLDLVAEAQAIGDQLNRLATTEQDRQLAAAYAATLARFLERRRTAAAEPAPGPAHPTSPEPPLKFTLPSHLRPLGVEVTRLVAGGQAAQAIQQVERALAQARYPYDRTALRNLLETLRGRIGQTGGQAPVREPPH